MTNAGGSPFHWGWDFCSKASGFKEMSFTKEIPDPLREGVTVSSLVPAGKPVLTRTLSYWILLLIHTSTSLLISRNQYFGYFQAKPLRYRLAVFTLQIHPAHESLAQTIGKKYQALLKKLVTESPAQKSRVSRNFQIRFPCCHLNALPWNLLQGQWLPREPEDPHSLGSRDVKALLPWPENKISER